MRIRRRMKRTTRQYIMVAVICVGVIGGAALLASSVITGQIRAEISVLIEGGL